MKPTELVDKIHERFCNIKIDNIKKQKNKKKDTLKQEIKKGFDHINLFEVKQSSAGIFSVEGSSEGREYGVSISDFNCTCASFNCGDKLVLKNENKQKYSSFIKHNRGKNYGKICKHITASIIYLYKNIEKMGTDEIKEMDEFEFVNHSRFLCSNDLKLKNFVTKNIYPVTISEEQFKIFYSDI